MQARRTYLTWSTDIYGQLFRLAKTNIPKCCSHHAKYSWVSYSRNLPTRCPSLKTFLQVMNRTKCRPLRESLQTTLCGLRRSRVAILTCIHLRSLTPYRNILRSYLPWKYRVSNLLHLNLWCSVQVQLSAQVLRSVQVQLSLQVSLSFCYKTFEARIRTFCSQKTALKRSLSPRKTFYKLRPRFWAAKEPVC